MPKRWRVTAIQAAKRLPWLNLLGQAPRSSQRIGLTAKPVQFGIPGTMTALPALLVAAPMTMLLFAAIAPAHGADTKLDTRCYEMRTYYANEGKLEALHDRFRDHAVHLLEKHGIVNIGYWVPVENPERKLHFILAYPSREAREKMWQTFIADPQWQEAFRASETGGRLVAKVENVFLQACDYSPPIRTGISVEPRLFELRVYTAAPGRLDALNARFRNHTTGLFRRHEIGQFGYWIPMKDQPGADNTLIYLLTHPNREHADAAFGAFRKDPDWVAARASSEEQAGGSLTAPNGVTSEFLKATDYSPTR
jgi:hypothetical protein